MNATSPFRRGAALGLALLLAPALRAADSITIVARVGSGIITSEDVTEAVAPVVDAMTPAELATPEGQKKVAEARSEVLDNMIDQKLVIMAAKEGPDGYADAAKDNKALHNPFLPDDSDIEAQMEKVFDQTRQRFSDEDAFEAALAKEHLSVPEYRDRLRKRVRDEMTFERMEKIKEQEFRPSLAVSAGEALDYYNAHKDEFFQGPEVELRHILFPSDELARARHFLAVLRSRPAKERKALFIDLARKYSADAPTKDQGGLLGWIQKGQSWPEIEKVAFAAPDDSLAGPVRTTAGWHLLYIEGHRPGRELPFDAVKTDVDNVVYQKKLHKRIKEWIAELKTKYYVQENGTAE